MQRRVLKSCLVLASAGPTLVWALSGGDLLTDDWSLAARMRFGGFWPMFWGMAWDAPARPLAALVYCLQYAAFGAHPLPSLLLLAVLNAVVALLVLRIAERLLPPRIAVLTALAWAALPNRGSTRLWSVMLPGVLALAMLLLAALVLLEDPGRPLLAGVLVAMASLAYEAVVAVGVAALLLWAWKMGRTRWQTAAIATLLPLLSAGYVYLRSPKRTGGGGTPFTSATRLVYANIGTGILGPLAVTLGTLLLARLVLALVRATFPSFRPPSTEDKAVLAGAVLLVLGALPFLAAGFPFGTDGIFDRGNLVADLGTSLFIAGALAGVLHIRHQIVAWSLVVATLAWLLALNAVDVGDYRVAVRDGHQLVAQLAPDLPDVPSGGVLVVPTLPNRGGVAMFILAGDLADRLRLDREIATPPPIRVALDGEDLGAAPEAYRYNRLTREVSPRLP